MRRLLNAVVFLAASLSAQPTLVTITGPLYRAPGSLANGRVQISWNAGTSNGATILGGRIAAATIVNGQFSPALQLAANESGSYYTVTYSLGDGASLPAESWCVVAPGPVTVAAARCYPSLVTSALIPQQQLSLGSGLGDLLGFMRRSSTPTPSAEGQCYWDLNTHGILCTDASLTYRAIGSGGGAVSSVFGRTGAVVAASNDYAFSQISGAATLAQLPHGTANQLLKTNVGGTALEHATLSVGTSGSDFAVAFGAGTIALNLPTASASNRGALSTSDWSTFNAKESALTFSSPLSRSVNTISCPTCGLTGNPLSQFASTTSTQLRGIISDAVGAGGLVFATGNVATATALAANGANCSAGNYPLGVDASGNAESCTAVPTSLPPNGAAGGDLAGSYPNPTLASTTGTNAVVRQTNPSLGVGSNISTTETAGTGGVTATYLATKDTSAPTRYVLPAAGACGSGIAATTASNGGTFELYSVLGGIVTVTADGTVTAGHILTGGSTTPGRVADTGQTSLLSIPQTTCTVGVAQGSATVGQTFKMRLHQIYGMLPTAVTVATLPTYGTGSSLVGDVNTWTTLNASVGFQAGQGPILAGVQKDMYRVTSAAGTNPHEIFIQNVSVTTSGAQVLTFYVQSGTIQSIGVALSTDVGTGQGDLKLDTLTSTFSSGVGFTLTIGKPEAYNLFGTGAQYSTNGFVPITVAFTATSTINNINLYLKTTNNWTSAGTEFVNFYGLKVQGKNPSFPAANSLYLVTDGVFPQDVSQGGGTFKVPCIFGAVACTPLFDPGGYVTATNVVSPNQLVAPQIVCVGDSIFAINSGMCPGLSTTAPFGVAFNVAKNDAIQGRLAADMLARSDQQVDIGLRAPMASFNLAVIEGGVNDIDIAGSNAAQVEAIFIARHGLYRLNGWKTVAATITPCGPASCSIAQIQAAQQVNEFIRSVPQVYDALADVAADSLLFDPTNLTYYDSGQLHQTATGSTQYRTLVAAAVNSITSFTAAATPSYTARNQIAVAALGTPGTPTVAPQTASGTKSYSYKVAAYLPDGSHSAASAAGSTAAGFDSLAVLGHSHELVWTPVAGSGVTYSVWRTATTGTTTTTTGLIASGLLGATYLDAGAVGDGSTPPSTNTTGKVTAPSFTGALTGNADTATALAANGTNCGAGQAAQGVDASGNAEGCFTPSGGSSHNLLSSTHTDTAAATPVRGDIIVANSAPAWTKLALGSTGLYLKSNGTDLVYSTLAASGIGSCASHQFVTSANGDAAPTCSAIAAADVPTLNQNTTGTAAALTANGTNCSAGNYPLGMDASGNAESCTAQPKKSIPFLLDGGGSAIAVSSQTVPFTLDFACTITNVHIALSPSGTATVKWWRVNGGTAIPTSGNSINTSGISISSGTKLDSTTLTDFTSTALAANDTIIMVLTATSGAATQLSGSWGCQP